MAGLADLRIILVEHLTVGEDQSDVGGELVVSFVTVEHSNTALSNQIKSNVDLYSALSKNL